MKNVSFMEFDVDGYLITNGREDGLSPFDITRLYGDEKYNLQDMILAEYNAPNTNDLPNGLKCYSVYSDQMHKEWDKNSEDISSSHNGDAFWAGVSNINLLKFARKMFTELSAGKTTLYEAKRQVKGVRIVRYTNYSTGYPCYRLDIIFRELFH